MGPSTQTSQPLWRSMLFVPAHREEFVRKAHEKLADAYILDLEDSVPLSEKHIAREGIIAAAESVSQKGAAAIVRINEGLDLATRDLEACINPAIDGVVIPKVSSSNQLQHLCQLIEELETKRDMQIGHTRVVAQIECVEGLANLDNIAQSSSRLIGMSLGTEDFATSAGMEPIPEGLLGPSQAIVFACRRANILPFGFPASIADYSDLDQFKETIRFARQLGFVGALCIHPSQVSVLNEAFSPNDAEIEQARAIVAAYDKGLSEGKGAVAFQGTMIDAPVVTRARQLLNRFS